MGQPAVHAQNQDRVQHVRATAPFTRNRQLQLVERQDRHHDRHDPHTCVGMPGEQCHKQEEKRRRLRQDETSPDFTTRQTRRVPTTLRDTRRLATWRENTSWAT